VSRRSGRAAARAQCLNVAVGNIDGCPPNSDGRAVDAGCFMRYSDKPFFPANATVDLAAYLRSGEFIFAVGRDTLSLT
jgi:hypothetical protein